MIYDKPSNRLITRSGKSIVDGRTLALKMALGYDTSHLVVPEDDDTEKYGYTTGKDIRFKEEFDHLPEKTEDSTDQTEEKLNYILDVVQRSERFHGSVEEVNRLDEEIDYFIRMGNIKFIFDVLKLIENFKKEETLWGVGRGSSCASFLMYVLGVNDINPLTYNVSFTEMTKE